MLLVDGRSLRNWVQRSDELRFWVLLVDGGSLRNWVQLSDELRFWVLLVDGGSDFLGGYRPE